MTCVSNPKSNGTVEKFHCTMIEHLRILNQRNELKNVNKENKIKLAIIAYNESINQITKFTPKEILYGKVENKSPFEEHKMREDYLNQYKENLKFIHDLTKSRIEKEKAKLRITRRNT